MKKSLGRALSWLLCLSLLWGVVAPTGALAVRNDETPEIPVLDGVDDVRNIETPSRAEPMAAAGEYEIYPTPHWTDYGAASSTVTLPTTMQVTYGAGIDEYTKARAEEAFEQVGVTLDESASTAVALQVRIKGDSETVSATTADLFDKTSAYKLVIDGTGVTVIGKDTDAAFYGLTTVKRILEQVEGSQVRHLTIEDYADVTFRGFIEGYYGQPWTTEDRAKLMEFGGEFKMNIYFYAPKNDPKHNEQWRVPYSEEELEDLIKPLAEAGERSKCRFGYALHCFMSSPFRFDTEDNYQEDLAILETKYEQGIAAGARQIALLADDAGAPGGALGSGNGGGDGYVKLLNDLTDWLKSDAMQTKYPGLQTTIPFCPADYGSGTGNSSQLKKLNDAPEGVSIIMTGGAVYGTVNSSFLSAFKNNVGRGAYLWINWPCSDNVRTRIMMLGQDKFLKTGVDPETIEGIMLNPMQQSEPSKVGLFCNADYAWNIWDTEQDGFDAWNDSFKYVENMSAASSDEADAFRLLSLHMGYNIDGRPPKTDESQDMWPLMTAFRTAMESSALTDAQISELRAEYEKLYDAVILYKYKTTGNQRILGKRDGEGGYPKSQEQLLPWLDCAEEFLDATLTLLDTISLSIHNENGANDSEIVENYLSAQQELTASQNHDFWSRSNTGDFFVKPEFGGQRLVPFTNELLAKVAETAKTIIDPSIFVETVITNRGEPDEGKLADVRDGSTSTYISFHNPNDAKVGDYIGLRFNRPIDLDSVRFEMGDAGQKNSFTGCKLEYTTDGSTWMDVPGTPTRVTSGTKTVSVAQSDLGLKAMGIRLTATEAVTDIYLSIKEIYINGEENASAAEESGIYPATASISSDIVIRTSGQTLANMTDNDTGTEVHLCRPTSAGEGIKDKFPAGGWVQIDLGSAKQVDHISILQDSRSSGGDKMVNAILEYSVNGTDFTEIASGLNDNSIERDVDITARYIRLRNGDADTNGWVRVAEFSASAVIVPNDVDKIAYQSERVKSISNPFGTLTDDSALLKADGVILLPGQFVGIALPSIRTITEVVADYTPAPGVVLEVGINESEMVEVDLDARAALPEFARYIRLRNAGNATVSFVLNELSVVMGADGPVEVTFVETNIGTSDAYYRFDDARALGTTGNWFDGNLDTVATYATSHVAGEYVLYDLGQTKVIRKIDAVISSNATNYVRSGEIQISLDGETWTKVVEITTTATDDAGGFNTTPVNAGWENYTVPNYSYKTGTIAPTEARYLRLYITKTHPGGRFPALGEIIFNDGAYISSFNDPSYVATPTEVSADFTPDKMRDGDLTTGFKPDMTGRTSGSIIYRVSEDTSIGQINVMASNDMDATVSVRTGPDTWQTLTAKAGGGLSQIAIPEEIGNVFEIKLEWGNIAPTIYELITVSREAAPEAGEQVSSEKETVAINSYSGSDVSILFNENWKFNLGDASGAGAKVFNDSSWRTVNLPHDYSIEQEYTSAGEAESGWLPGGVGWYRKSFTVDAGWANQVVTIDFDGAYMDTEVYLNGTKLGEHHYGYTAFSFVLPSNLLDYTGENVIAVKTNNPVPTSRWYSGSGIYRDVYLTVSAPVHVAKNGVTITTPNLEAEYKAGGNVAVNITATVENSSGAAASVTVKNTVFKGETAVANATIAAQSVSAGGTTSFAGTVSVPAVELWSVDTPNLYRLHTEVMVNGGLVDTYDSEFGFRWFTIDVNTGFALNGVPMKLKGVCLHNDQGAVGSETWYRAMERQVEILKDMGCNSIRITHNPGAKEFINICNRKGILVIEEIFDGWHILKNSNSNDFARWFDQTIGADNALIGKKANETWAQFVLEATIGRDKNDPSVIAWSLGNEIKEGSGGADEGYTTRATSLITWGRAADATRPLTFGDNKLKEDWAHAINISNQLAALDNVATGAIGGTRGGWVGMNYVTDTQLDSKHENYPTWPIYASETASHINSRGVYNVKNSGALNSNKLLTSYDKSAVSWGKVASDAWYTTIINDYCAGEYIWTGFDYLGEPTPANQTTIGTGWNDTAPKNSYFGAVDTNGLPKDNYYLYRAMWNEKDTTLHVLPTWDQSDLLLTGGKAEVVVYSNAPVIRVYLNGTEVGAAKATTVPTDAGFTYRTFSATALKNGDTNTFQTASGHRALYATFNVPYEAGTLEVKAFESEAATAPMTATVGRSVVKTTTGANQLKLTADRDTIKNDGMDLSYITIDVVDANGEIVNGATPEITVSVDGDGVLIGLDNGVQPDHTSYQSSTRKAGAGRLVAIVQSTKAAGTFTVTARSAGLVQGTVEVSTGGATSTVEPTAPISYEISKLYYVQRNTAPELPAMVTVKLGSGQTVEKAVNWDSYNASQLGTVGNEFAITGTIADYNVSVSVGVVVVDDIVALLNYSTAIQVGGEPVLPSNRPAVMADGTVLSAQFPVEWAMPESSAYEQEGTVEITGTAQVFGKNMTVTAWVRVSKGGVVEGLNMASYAKYPMVDNVEDTELLNVFDGDTATTWTGSGAATIGFDTAQNFYRITVTYEGEVPQAGVKISTSPDGINWTPISAKKTTNGQTVTYALKSIHSAERLKFEFSTEVTVAEVALIVGTPTFDIGATAELDDLKLSGVSASATALAERVIKTASAMAVVEPVSEWNIAYTILPEDENGAIIIVTESEDHSKRDQYTVILGMTDIEADDDSRDYPVEKTTPAAESQAGPGSNGEGGVGNATDGDPGTFWHTNWGGAGGSGTANPTDVNKRYIELVLDETTSIVALRYLPRSNVHNGTVTSYRVDVSTDGTNFTTVATGDWARVAGWKMAKFDAVSAKYVRLYGVHTYGDTGNDQFMSAAEVRVVKAPDAGIDLSPAVVTVSPESYDWTNSAIEPTGVTVSMNGQTLVEGTDYTLSYDHNIDPGTGYVYVNGMGDYRGVASGTFTIVKVQATVTGFEAVTASTREGVYPVLPEMVTAMMSAGPNVEMEVEWDEVLTSDYVNPMSKSFTVEGTVEGTDVRATATVTVYWATSADEVSAVTPKGFAPTLPETVLVHFENGTSERFPVVWNLAGKNFNTANTTVTVNGTVTGLSRITARASVQVVEAEESDKNFALNENSAQNIFPFALAYWSSGNNNPYQAISGHNGNGTETTQRWSDWERDTYHDPAWLGVAFEARNSVTSRGENTQVDLEKYLVNRVKVMFVDEGNKSGTSDLSGVTFPESYEIQYYTGPVEGLKFDTRITVEAQKDVGNGTVRNWTNSPLLNEANWTTVRYTGTKPAVVTQNGTLLEVSFDTVNTAMIRVKVKPRVSKWVGIAKLEAYGLEMPESSDFTVTSIKVGGVERKDDFNANKVLNVVLGVNDAIPQVSAVATNNARIVYQQATTVPGAATITITSDDGSKSEVYTVNFTRGEAPSYTVTLPAGGQITASPAGGVAGTEITLSAPAGYELADLTVTANGQNVAVDGNKFVMPEGNVTVSATLRAIVYTITYNLNGGEVETANKTSYTVEDESFTLVNPTKEGYLFAGWTGTGLSRATTTVTVAKGSTGARAYTATWKTEGGSSSSGSGTSAPVGSNTEVDDEGNKITTDKDTITGETTVTTEAPDGTTTTVTTAASGKQTAEVALPEDAAGEVELAMPELTPGTSLENAPTVTVSNPSGNTVNLVIPVTGGNTIVAVRVEEDGSETVVPMSVVDENGLRVKIEDDATLKIVDNKKNFIDVPNTFWGAEAVDFVASRELFSGVSAEYFAPSRTMNRAMMVTVLWRMAERPASSLEATFDDVKNDAYYADAVRWGAERGVVTGTGSGFSPEGEVTREMLAVFLYRMAGSPAVVDELPRRFVDADEVSSWAAIPLAWAIQQGIVTGRSGGKLAPKDTATRAEAAAMLQRYINSQV